MRVIRVSIKFLQRSQGIVDLHTYQGAIGFFLVSDKVGNGNGGQNADNKNKAEKTGNDCNHGTRTLGGVFLGDLLVGVHR